MYLVRSARNSARLFVSSWSAAVSSEERLTGGISNRASTARPESGAISRIRWIASRSPRSWSRSTFRLKKFVIAGARVDSRPGVTGEARSEGSVTVATRKSSSDASASRSCSAALVSCSSRMAVSSSSFSLFNSAATRTNRSATAFKASAVRRGSDPRSTSLRKFASPARREPSRRPRRVA